MQTNSKDRRKKVGVAFGTCDSGLFERRFSPLEKLLKGFLQLLEVANFCACCVTGRLSVLPLTIRFRFVLFGFFHLGA
jgi:hypothetical protein